MTQDSSAQLFCGWTEAKVTTIVDSLSALSVNVDKLVGENRKVNTIVDTLNALSVNVNELIRETREQVSQTRALRECEVRLQKLHDAFAACEQHVHPSLTQGRLLTLPERDKVVAAWKDVQQPYIRVQTYVSDFSDSERYRELLEQLGEAYDALESAIVGSAALNLRREIPRFELVLSILREEISEEAYR